MWNAIVTTAGSKRIVVPYLRYLTYMWNVYYLNGKPGEEWIFQQMKPFFYLKFGDG
jgi:hypothetical protein